MDYPSGDRLGSPLNKLADLKTNRCKHGQEFFIRLLNIPVKEFYDTNNIEAGFNGKRKSGMEAFLCSSGSTRKIRVGHHIGNPDRFATFPNTTG